VRPARALTIAAASAALLMPVSALSNAAADAVVKPHRTISAKVTKPHSTLQLHAHVANYPNRATFLQKRNCAACGWHVVSRRRTSDVGRVMYPLGAPLTGRWYYRMGTPETPRFAASYSQTFYTYRS
jgi:hypothetical protein